MRINFTQFVNIVKFENLRHFLNIYRISEFYFHFDFYPYCIRKVNRYFFRSGFRFSRILDTGLQKNVCILTVMLLKFFLVLKKRDFPFEKTQIFSIQKWIYRFTKLKLNKYKNYRKHFIRKRTRKNLKYQNEIVFQFMLRYYFFQEITVKFLKQLIISNNSL